MSRPATKATTLRLRLNARSYCLHWPRERSLPLSRWNLVDTRQTRHRATPRRRWSSDWRNSASVVPRPRRRSSRRPGPRLRWKKGQALVPTWTAFAVVGLFDKFRRVRRLCLRRQGRTTSRRHRRRPATQRLAARLLLRRRPGRATRPFLSLSGTWRRTSTAWTRRHGRAPEIGHDAEGDVVVVEPSRYGPTLASNDTAARSWHNLPADELSDPTWPYSLLAAPKADQPIGGLDRLPSITSHGGYSPYVHLGPSRRLPPRSFCDNREIPPAQVDNDALTLDDAVALAQPPRTWAPILPTANLC